MEEIAREKVESSREVCFGTFNLIKLISQTDCFLLSIKNAKEKNKLFFCVPYRFSFRVGNGKRKKGSESKA